MKWTMSMVRAINQDAGHHHFDRKTMRFFGETMRNYRIAAPVPPTASLEPFAVIRSGGRAGFKRYTFDPSTGDMRAQAE